MARLSSILYYSQRLAAKHLKVLIKSTGGVIRYRERLSIRYREKASIRYRALKIFQKEGGYKVQPYFPGISFFSVRLKSAYD